MKRATRAARFNTNGGWLGFGDTYWLAALVAGSNGNSVDAGFRKGGGTYQAEFVRAPKLLGARASPVTTNRTCSREPRKCRCLIAI